MLKELKIAHFAIIESLRVEFREGFNVLTGETGAGKSIIIDALNLILGGRADTDFIRTGEAQATVEACFEIHDPALLDPIRERGIEVEGGEIIIKRVLSAAGKSRCFINDSQITVSTLAQIGDRLVDIHGQHDHQSLLRPETHVDLLDLYGKTLAARQALADGWSAYQAGRKALEDRRAREKDRESRQELLAFQLGEIDRAELAPGEDEALLAEKKRLQNAEKIHQTVEEAQGLLDEAEGSVIERLGRAINGLEALVGIDPALEEKLTRAQTAYFEVEALVDELRGYGRTLQFDPVRLEEIEDRLAEINGLKRKHGGDIAAILARRDALREELESLAGSAETQAALEADLKRQETALEKQAAGLAEAREATAKRFEKNVVKELRDLDMASVQFGVSFRYEPDAAGFVRFRGQTVGLSAKGIGAIEFLFSPNPGEEMKPLAKIASGGELSRVMLALKSILNDQDTVPVMIFDEVDTGIGGKVAEKVGHRLKKVAAGRQVFSITHLPQIAGMAQAHYRVQKDVSGKRTQSTIRELTMDERVEEIARMSGGEKITEATLKHAREMLRP